MPGWASSLAVGPADVGVAVGEFEGREVDDKIFGTVENGLAELAALEGLHE